MLRNPASRPTMWGERTTALMVGLSVIGALLIAILLSPPAHAASFTVTTTNDTGAGSLREAILKANANDNPGKQDRIKFNIPGTGVQTITPASPLPFITEPVIIDGYTQPGADPNTLAKGTNAKLLIQIDGTNVAEFEDGLTIEAPNSVVRGLVINRFEGDGIIVKVGSSASRIEGNFIGTDPSGTIDEGNEFQGVSLFFHSNTTTVGGTSPAKRNLISGNDSNGIEIFVSKGNKVLGNLIGTDKTGTGDLGNGEAGIDGFKASNSFVGDGSSGGTNTIAFNGFDSGGSGVEIGTSDDASGRANGNRILRNSIFSNQDLGIDLNRDGPTLNDSGDEDVGPNRLQNFPLLSSAKRVSGKTTIKGKLNSTPNRTYTIQFFSNPSSDEGKKFIGEKSVSTDGSGNAAFTFSPNDPAAVGQKITATATRNSTGDTSEFSAPREVASS